MLILNRSHKTHFILSVDVQTQPPYINGMKAEDMEKILRSTYKVYIKKKLDGNSNP